jgi:hypothetical protein
MTVILRICLQLQVMALMLTRSLKSKRPFVQKYEDSVMGGEQMQQTTANEHGLEIKKTSDHLDLFPLLLSPKKYKGLMGHGLAL